ncbi:thiamine-phosphate synthase family protein [Halostella litorea]|uniref:thiamine-phosphate synthase family protein n=1 Tax=Halostella litorea TaxID=2528831 RepID=UPI00109243B4|nr:thiamine-phosphate synthase family protein [Halostella litorea]
MKFVEEIVVEEFLPTLRSMLAEDLRDRGLTQSEVAEALGISQSAVSKYAHGDVARRAEFTEDERVQDLVERVGEGLTEGGMSPVQALVEAEVLIRRLEDGDVLARLHEEAMPELAEYDGSFRVHDPESELRTTERVLSSLRRGLRRLENTSGFATLIPAVGSNLVVCTPDAADLDDVAGVPGRIFDVKGRATVPSEPEFGVSEHVATVLLSARRAGSDARAALNVRYDPDIVDRLADAGLSTVEFDGDRPTDEAVAAALGDAPGADVLYQTGGYGVEPIVYLLGPDAETVAERVGELV